MTSARPSGEPRLSVCVPTYGRRERVCALAGQLLTTDLPVELCIHVDGDIDGTAAALRRLAGGDGRLRLSVGENQGRAGALQAAIQQASAPFAMIYDDDDDIDIAVLARLIERLAAPLPPGVCGYCYRMADQDGAPLGGPFPAARSNFLKMRADEGVQGDAKEVVQTPTLQASYQRTPGSRRAPTSATWAAIALDQDVLCVNEVMGRKDRLPDGLSRNMAAIKMRNPRPMVGVHALRIQGFRRGRYRSLRYLAKSTAAAAFFGVVALAQEALGRMRGPHGEVARP